MGITVQVVEDVEIVQTVHWSTGQIVKWLIPQLVIDAIDTHLTIRQIDNLTCCSLPAVSC
jgi:hypothetical protein